MSSKFSLAHLESVLNFANGRSSPDRDDSYVIPVYGSNGLIGKAAEANSPKNTIVIGRVGSYCGSVHFSKEPCWVTDNAIRATAKGDNDASFLYYLLKYLNLNNWRSGSGQPLINQATLNAIEAPIPSPTEQRVIAGLVGSLDERITLLRETNATLEAIAQALFKSWFVDFDPVRAKQAGRAPEGMDEATAALFPDELEESELGLVPKGWKVGTMENLFRLHKGSVNPCIRPDVEFQHFSLPAFDESQMPVLEPGYAIKSNKTSVPDNAVLLSKLNPHIPRVWLPSFVGENAVCSTEFLPFLPTGPSTTAFVYSLLTASDFSKALCQLVTGTSNSHQRVKPDSVLSLPTVIPPGEVVMAFDAIAGELFKLLRANRQQIQTLAGLRDTLLPRLISGQLRLPEAHSMVESV